jgi:tetratricopeptide (TPR) repeat protein
MEFRLALKDSEEGIKLDPNFRKFKNDFNHKKCTIGFVFLVKCYLRKGNVLMAMKDLGQAMSAFGKALEIDPNCQVRIYSNQHWRKRVFLLIFRKRSMGIDNVR